jgi:hypothetical protein
MREEHGVVAGEQFVMDLRLPLEHVKPRGEDLPWLSARARACSSITGPREVLISTAVGFHQGQAPGVDQMAGPAS